MSNNLNISQVATNQSQKETTINDATGQLDAAVTEVHTADLTSGNATLTSAQFRGAVLFLCSGHSVSRVLTVPQLKRSLFGVQNSGTGDVAVTCGSTAITLRPGLSAMYATDGTANGLRQLTPSALASEPAYYDVAVFVAGKPTDGETVLRFVAPRTFTLPASLTGSYAKAAVASAGSVSFDIQHNGSSVGSIAFVTSATGAFTFASAVAVAAGDTLTVTAPATADTNLTDVAITLKGLR